MESTLLPARSQWEFRPKQQNLDLVDLAQQLEISPFLADILTRRGLTDLKTIDEFLSPKLARLTNPSLWPNIPDCAQLIVEKLCTNHKMVIWGDYDVDGVTATALCLEILEYHGIRPGFYIPSRTTEGYGLNMAGLERLKAQGFDLLLTVDCGIANVKEIDYAKSLGFTTIVSDHHLPAKELPKADAICNPKVMPKEKTPYQDLAGVGVAFYLMAEVNRLLAQALKTKPYPMDLVLDLVALGTLADLMPLTGENRLLVSGGLKHIKAAKRIGIAALKIVSGTNISAEMKSIEISFKLAPRLNAAGRIEHANSALALLTSKDQNEAIKLAEHLDALNNLRRSEEEKILTAARLAANTELTQSKRTLVLYGENWHPGIIGIVAARIVEEFGKITFVLCKHQDVFKGSGRSMGEVDLYNILTRLSEHLLAFGGHKSAAAITLAPEKFAAFKEAFEEIASQYEFKPKQLTIDGELDLSNAFCAETIDEISLLEPFGQANPEPIFSSPPLIVERHDYLGYEHKNIILTVYEPASGIRMQAKGWRMATSFPPSSLAGKEIRLAYILRLNTFRGIPQPELEIKDILRLN
ncbi:MAG: single-stranded-DNA-specific exonuclease RecJ [Desulfovibrionaceae bacterium]|nr:single-stranded-DNA-specific exonuclease RecJ [Desulfovibrionaceae bacterium]